MLGINGKRSNYISLLGIGLGLFVIYMLWIARRPTGVFWSLDEGGKFLYLQNVLRTGDPGAPLLYLGRSVDPGLQFVPLYFWNRKEDLIFPWWPVGFPLMSLPFYKFWGWAGLYVLPALGGALTSVLTGAIVQELKPSSRNLPLWAAIITGLTTPVAFYSTAFWEHTLSTALSTGLVLSVILAIRTGNWKWLVIGGISGAISVFLRAEAGVITFGVLTVMFFYRRSWALFSAATFGIIYLAFLALNRILSGEFFGGQAGSLIHTPFFAGLSRAGWMFLPSLLFNTSLVLAYPVPTWMMIGGSICVGATVIGIWTKHTRWIAICAILGIALLSAFVLIQPYGYRSVHGFVLIAPHVVFAAWLYQLPKSYLQRMFGWMLIASGVLCGVAYVLRAWLAAGGLQWGPRYLLPFYPLCVVGGLLGLEGSSNPKRLSRYFLIGIYILSVLIGMGYQIRGAYALWYTTRLFQNAGHQIENLEADALVTPCTWMPMVIPKLYWDRPIFAVHNEESLHRWSVLAAQAGLQKVYLVDMEICLHIPLDEVEQRLKINPSGITAYPFDPSKIGNMSLPVEWR
ncbi:MAG: hypothetical protein ACP5N6_15075 [Anaerolineae bacterium]|uniref:hypothetical protein n=1 Tax=Thermanaerothrix sp. TaxID=2972675 RepID=UPI003C7CFD81